MVSAIQSIKWTPLGTDGENRIATLILDSAVDTLFNISNSGTGVGDDMAANVSPNWILVDNLRNNGYVTLTMGNFTIQVPPFQRESIGIPSGTRVFSIQLFAGVVGITLSEARLVDNQSNALLVSQTSVKTLIFAYLFYNATTLQSTSDVNSSILFTPTIANMEYTLLPVSGQIGDGFYVRLQNGGNKIVTVRPDGGDTINSPLVKQYNNADPLLLYPGDSGVLTSDGFKWYYVADQNLADFWAFQPIGVPIPLYDHLAGIVIPPTDRAYRYARLTAGQSGVGGYNNGILSGEVTTGVFPLNVVTANISLASSPLNGQAINLINTERRFLRAGSPGVAENDLTQGFKVRFGSEGTGDGVSLPNNGGANPYAVPWQNAGGLNQGNYFGVVNDGANGNPRHGIETRPKDIGATYYMRIR